MEIQQAWDLPDDRKYHMVIVISCVQSCEGRMWLFGDSAMIMFIALIAKSLG